MLNLGQKGDDGGILSTVPWIIAGGAIGYGLYLLLRPKPEPQPQPGQTQAAPVAPLAPPSRFANIESVSIRLAQVKELYRMGYLTPEQSLNEVSGLFAAAMMLSQQTGEALEGALVLENLRIFENDVRNFMKLQESGVAAPTAAPAIAGAFPVMNRRPS